MTNSKRPECPKCGSPMQFDKRPSGKTAWRCRPGGVHCFSTTDPGLVEGNRSPKPIQFKQRVSGEHVLIITAAQNATPVHRGFWQALSACAAHRAAKRLVCPIRYKNPTSRWEGSQRNEQVWDEAVVPYLHNQRSRINKNLTLLGDVKVQPTAVSPLTGFEGMTHSDSGILPHTKLQLRAVPTPQNKMAKILATTGACTESNYTDTRAGKQGDFHHTLGALIVEVRGGKFFMRQISAKSDGSFIDLDTEYLPDGTYTRADPALALVQGDTHVDFIDPAVERATFGADGIVETVKPKHLIWHDLLDGYAVNPHHGASIFNMIAKRQSGHDDIRREVERALQFVEERTHRGQKSIIVPSNHDDFLRRWILNSDWREDPVNASFYLRTAQFMVDNTEMTPNGVEYPSPFVYWARQYYGSDDRFRALDMNESFTLADVELGMHGDRGPNGARGSAKNLRRIGTKSIIGHSHTPAIEEGCYQVGTSTKLRLEYNTGPSSWLNAHCVLYANGKRSLILIVDGEWRLS